MTRARDLASLGDNTGKLEQQGLVQVVASSVTKGASGSASVDSKGTITFSGTETIALNGIFSSTYDNYRIIGNSVGSSAGVNVNFRMRVSGTDNNTANSYRRQYLYGESSSTGASNLTSDVALLFNSDTISGSFIADFFDPFATKRTKIHSSFFYQNLLSGFSFTDHNQTVSYDGINIIPTSGTFTGTIRVYGYNQ